ncbi:hypothetical protein ACHQM5_015549 [Ranunculus cassubicifolius]
MLLSSHEEKCNVKELKSFIEPLSGRSLLYCTDACLRRYLEARIWDVEKAKKMLVESLKWRSTYKPEEILWHQVANEGESGKAYRANFHDRYGRTVLILRPGKENTSSADNQLRYLVYLMENTILNLPESQDSGANVMACRLHWMVIHQTYPIKTSRDSIHILQNHYPERLAVVFLYNPPRIFEAFWKIVKYFLDAKSFQKVKFVYPMNKESVELMSSYFNDENLPTEFGGSAKFQYDHEEFSRMMLEDEVKGASLWGLHNRIVDVSNIQ